MDKKLLFYDRHGVEEYYLYDPDTNELSGWLRIDGYLDVIEPISDYVSPRLKIRFDLSGEELQIYRPDGGRFLSYTETARQMEQERQRATQAEERAAQAEERATQAEERAARLAERLRQAGIDPNEA